MPTVLFVPKDPTAQLGHLVSILNEPEKLFVPAPGMLVMDVERSAKQFKDRFSRLTETWQKAQRNVNELFKQDTEMMKRSAHLSTRLQPDASGNPTLEWEYGRDLHPADMAGLAEMLFISLVLNSRSQYLGGPCVKCGRFFVKKTVRQTKFCTRRCAASMSAKRARSNRQARQHTSDLKTANEAIARWNKIRRKGNWKSHVSAWTNLSQNWLTRAEKRGELRVIAIQSE